MTRTSRMPNKYIMHPEAEKIIFNLKAEIDTLTSELKQVHVWHIPMLQAEGKKARDRIETLENSERALVRMLEIKDGIK